MAITPNRWTEETLSDFSNTDVFTEGVSEIFIRAGWHDDPTSGETILIEQEIHSVNQYGVVIRRDEKSWEFEVHGAPPLRYEKRTYSSMYLPDVNIGRFLRLVDEEISIYHPWTAFQPGGANLSRQTLRSGWVVYDMTPDGRALTADEKTELKNKGIDPNGLPTLIVDSARPWHQANHLGEVVETAAAPQTSKWVDPYESEIEIVFEEPDKYTIYSIAKNHLKPQDANYRGPQHQRKESYQYRLPVAIEPPEIKASGAGDDGIRLEVSEGGATVNERRIHPEQYRILRKTISEPSRSAEDDPFDLWDTPPTPANKSTLWIDTDTTDLDGAPATSLPTQDSYTEPGDNSEPEPEGWIVLGEFDNEAPATDPGFASTIDGEVLNAGVYEYVATAIIGRDESAPSSPVRFTFGGADRKSRITSHVRRGDEGIDIDVAAPTDPELLDDDYGETVEFDIPIVLTEEEAEDFGTEIGERQFADDRDSGLEIDVRVNVPLVVLERGQIIKTPAIEWTATGNELVITSETESRDWILDGFRLSATMGADGNLQVTGTDLFLVEL